MKALFPHQKLDWTIDRLREQVERAPDDPAVRVELARVLLARGLFHGGGATDFRDAHGHARRALRADPADLDAAIAVGLALVGLQRETAARRALEGLAGADDRAELHLGLGLLEIARSDPPAAVRHLEAAVRAAPEAWECHMALGRALMRLARSGRRTRRVVERAQYHLVQALRREPTPDVTPPILEDLGVTCIWTGRWREAERLFVRLKEHDRYAASARYHLGIIAYELGKYNNSIQHFRGYLRHRPDDARVLARMAMAWFQLGNHRRAREACHQALVVDPNEIEARFALGCTLVEDGEPAEAIKVFREALHEHPEHMPTYVELARLRRRMGDLRWLVQALVAEVGTYDRLPHGGQLDARRLTRERIGVLLDELRAVGPSTIGAVLGVIERTQDEGLRFQLWEAACAMSLAAVADDVSAQLRDAGRTYGPELAGRALAASLAIPEPVLAAGLRIKERDLKRAAVERHGPAHDVAEFQRNLDHERAAARAHQALLLLAVAARRSSGGRDLLRSWADAADAELAVAAWTGLALYGEPDAARRLAHRADHRGVGVVVERLLRRVTPPRAHREPRRVSEDEETRCSTCGRPSGEVARMIAGGEVVLCDHCAVEIRRYADGLAAPDEATCGLCGRTPFEAAVYRYNGVDVCARCLQVALGMLERDEVDRFFASW